jgi:hypothetical protein
MKKLIITLLFKKNANFFAENWRNSQKIEIMTSTTAPISTAKDDTTGPHLQGPSIHTFYRQGMRLKLAKKISFVCQHRLRLTRACLLFLSIDREMGRKFFSC